MAVQDYKKGIVPNCLYLPMLPFIKPNLIIISLFILSFLLFKLYSKHLGGADIKLFFIFLAIYPLYNLMWWLFFSLFSALIYATIKKRKKIKMFPFFFGSYLGTLFWL